MKSPRADAGRGRARLDLADPLERVGGIGPRRAAAFAGEEVRNVEDLLRLLPLRYEDRRRFAGAGALAEGDRATVSGRVRKARLRRTRIAGFTIFDAEIEDDSGALPCVWYNQPYLARVIREGSRIVLFGEAVRPERRPRSLVFQNPQYEILGDDPDGIHMGRIVPIYRRAADLSTRGLRTLVHRVLAALPPDLPDPLPPALVSELALPGRREAFHRIHFPPGDASLPQLENRLTPAHRRLALEELYTLQVAMARARTQRQAVAALACPRSPDRDDGLRRRAPFPLTGGQARALDELLADLSRPHPMSRLLQGDVGCGKTLVAALSAVRAIESGGQVAWMVPTEILAEQHGETLRRLLEGDSRRIEVLTGDRPRAAREGLESALAAGEVDLIVGTHALIQRRVRFRRLALVIIDEQHRFGVRQRARLDEKGEGPHLLMMTATPIPRSLALATYGDLDVSRIDGMPPGRAAIRTFLRRGAARDAIYRFIRREVERGGRAVIVYPSLLDRPAEERRSAMPAFRRLSEGPLRGLRVGLVHGKLAPEKRRRTMAGFAAGAIEVLVATSVIEVGIDIPQATVMLIEAADRFGLAQLHQMRGRVGRGSRAGTCILIPDEAAADPAVARLELLTRLSSGFEIAEKDLEWRGPGEIRGVRQSGDPEFRIADLARDGDLLALARRAVEIGSAGGQEG